MKRLYACLIAVALCWTLAVLWSPAIPQSCAPYNSVSSYRPFPPEIELREQIKDLKLGIGAAALGLSIVGLVREFKIGRLLKKIGTRRSTERRPRSARE